jgi:phosphatidylglycerophosphate synthase
MLGPVTEPHVTEPAGSPSPRCEWRTRANALTALRLAAAPACAMAVACSSHGAAFALFVLAVATDFADGRVARRYGEASAFGGVFDHATDATFASLGVFAVALRGEAPLVLPVLIVAAFVQYLLDSRAVQGEALRASLLGRYNGIAYFVLLGIPVVRDGLGIGWPPQWLVLAIGWALVVTTLISMGDRLLALRGSGRRPR